MKKLALFSIVVVLILAISGIATALTSPAAVTVGGERQRASNPLADDESYYDAYYTASVTLTNEGDALKNLRLGTISPLMGFLANDLNVTVTAFPVTTLATTESTTVTLRARVPANLDAVNDNNQVNAFHVANVQFLATNSSNDVELTPVVLQLKMQRENQLAFDSITICLNGDCEQVEDGATIEDIKPGDELEMKFAVENKYKDNDREDISIEDVFLEWVIDEPDMDEEDDADFGDLSPKDVEEESFSFVVNDDVTDGTYNLKVRVSGKDENGATHGDSATIELKVKRARHDLALREVAAPASLSCDGGRDVAVNLEVANIGKTDEDESVVKLQNAKLGIDVSSGTFSVEESETKNINLRATIPEDAEAGTYQLKLSSYYDTTALSHESVVDFVVPKCEPVVEVKQPEVVVKEEPKEETQPVVEKRVVSPTKSNMVEDFVQGNAYMALLVVGIVLAMLILVFLVVRVVPPRKE